jgi:hypothetical protein
MNDIFSDYIKNYKKIRKHGFAFNKNIILKNEILIKRKIDDNYLLNPIFFYNKYQNYLDGNYDYEQYLWNEIILNFSRQNLENTKNSNIT